MQRRTPSANSNLRPVPREHDALELRWIAILDFHRIGGDDDGLFLVATRHAAMQRPAEQRQLESGEGQHWPIAHNGQGQRDRHRGQADAGEKQPGASGAQRAVRRQFYAHGRRG